MEYTRPVNLYNEYLDYFGFSEAPFSIAPNPDYLYMSDRHREALAHLLYGVNTDGGFVLIAARSEQARRPCVDIWSGNCQSTSTLPSC